MSSNSIRCEHWVYPTAYIIGKLPKRKCDKFAVIVDDNGRSLCQEHYNRYQKKINKHNHNKPQTNEQ